MKIHNGAEDTSRVGAPAFPTRRNKKGETTTRGPTASSRSLELWVLSEAGSTSSNVAPDSGGTQKEVPSRGGMPADNIALWGAGALLVGGGILLYKKSAIS